MDIFRSVVARTGTDDIIALTLVGSASVIWLTGGELPETLAAVTITVIGFFFGKKYTEQGVQRGIEAVNPPPAPPYIADPED